MKRPYSLDLLIASPSDVKIQRDLIEKTCGEWNRNKGHETNRVIHCLRWEKDLAITSGVTPQDEINEQLVANADLLIALFWTKFGSPTKRFESGSLEEIEQFIESSRPVIVYFIMKKINPKEIDPRQLEKVQAFKDKYRDKGIYREVNTDKELIDCFVKDLSFNIERIITRYENKDLKDSISDEKEIQNDILETQTINNDYWYEVSISKLINDYIFNENISEVVLKKGLTFSENCNLWRNVSAIKYNSLIDVAKKAREHAFNIKYGSYNYDKDLRSHHENWFFPIKDILAKFKNESVLNSKVIGVGSNNGSELLEVFPDFISNNIKLEVLDISTTAIEKGKLMHEGKIRFHKGNMEESPLSKESYDIYLNLRAIHSSGVDIKSTIAECFGVLKTEGVAIFSVSNGYLTPKKPGSKETFEINGMYESSRDRFSSDKPFYLAGKIRRKLEEYGFKKCRITTGDTEIFVYGIK